MNNNDHVDAVMNAAVRQLALEKEFVTPTTQYAVIHNWYTAWQEVATTPEDQELLAALEIAHDRLFCKLMNIQY